VNVRFIASNKNPDNNNGIEYSQVTSMFTPSICCAKPTLVQQGSAPDPLGLSTTRSRARVRQPREAPVPQRQGGGRTARSTPAYPHGATPGWTCVPSGWLGPGEPRERSWAQCRPPTPAQGSNTRTHSRPTAATSSKPIPTSKSLLPWGRHHILKTYVQLLSGFLL
jgi:hypothetical protein